MDYINCSHCSHIKNRHMTGYLCPKCNNSLLVPDPSNLLCNLCGSSMRSEHKYSAALSDEPIGLHNSQVSGEYFSEHLLDLHTYIFSLCEKCIRDLFSKCVIPPTVINYSDGIMCDYFTDQKIYEQELWKKSEAYNQAYLDKKCNAVQNCPNEAVYTILISDEEQWSNNCSCEKHKHPPDRNTKYVRYIPPNLKILL